MLLRSIRSHLVASCATLVLAFAVTAGAVAVDGASRSGHTPAAIGAMLALYGAVALAEQTARSTIDPMTPATGSPRPGGCSPNSSPSR